MKLRKRILTSAAGAFLLTTLLPATAASAATDSPCYKYRTAEREFARLTNAARAAAGKVSLHLDPELSRVARYHTREMVEKNLMYHTPFTKLGRRVTNWSFLGENIGLGATVEGLQNAFMSSPVHRDNILNSSFRHIGVGVIRKDGRMWVTVVFEARTNPGTRLSMPSC